MVTLTLGALALATLVLAEREIKRSTITDAANLAASAPLVDVFEPDGRGLVRHQYPSVPYAGGKALIVANPGCCAADYRNDGDAPPTDGMGRSRIVTLAYFARYVDSNGKNRSILIRTYRFYDWLGRRAKLER